MSYLEEFSQLIKNGRSRKPSESSSSLQRKEPPKIKGPVPTEDMLPLAIEQTLSKKMHDEFDELEERLFRGELADTKPLRLSSFPPLESEQGQPQIPGPHTKSARTPRPDGPPVTPPRGLDLSPRMTRVVHTLVGTTANALVARVPGWYALAALGHQMQRPDATGMALAGAAALAAEGLAQRENRLGAGLKNQFLAGAMVGILNLIRAYPGTGDIRETVLPALAHGLSLLSSSVVNYAMSQEFAQTETKFVRGMYISASLAIPILTALSRPESAPVVASAASTFMAVAIQTLYKVVRRKST